MMDNQPHERVEISDYPGVPNVPPLATPAAQRGIKQVEADAAPPVPPVPPLAGQNSPFGRIDRAIPHFSFSNEDGKLVLTKNKWRSVFSRLIFFLIPIYWFITVLPRQSFGWFEIIVSLIWLFNLVIYSRSVVKLWRGPGDQLIFDYAAGTLTDSQYPKAQPTSVSDFTEVDVDQQSREYRVWLRKAAGGTIKIGSWYNEAEALYTAGLIADYLNLPLERSETPARVISGCAFTVAVFVLLSIAVGLVLVGIGWLLHHLG